jgi:DNA polymerase-4
MALRALPMLGASMEKKLAPLGVHTLGDVAALPAVTLRALFGNQGAALAARCRGIDPTPVSASEGPPKSISREGTFTTDVADQARIRAVLRGFSESVASQLRAQERRARTVTLKVRFGDFSTISRSMTLAQPAGSDDAVYAAADALFEAVRSQDSRAVRLVGVGLSNFVPAERQLALQPGSDERSEALSKVLDRMRRKYGRRSLQTGRTAFDAATNGDSWRHDKSVGLSAQVPGG